MVHSESHKKALKDGLLTQKQYDKLPEALLDGIIKSKKKNGGAGKAKKKTKGTHKMGDGTVMTGKTHSKTSKPVKPKKGKGGGKKK
tara:strand:+ start:8916 stop:9173 length:258 start_codon:yes stop_codon:yes gene_type:complete